MRTGRLFGGLINDIKRKTPHYLSDFRDGLHPQIISSFLFLYFACLAPIIAFGALLGEATKNRIATIEGLVAGRASKDGSRSFHSHGEGTDSISWLKVFSHLKHYQDTTLNMHYSAVSRCAIGTLGQR